MEEEEEKLQRQEERARKRRMLERQKQESLADANQNKNDNQTDEENNSGKRKRLEDEDEYDKDAMEEVVSSNRTRQQNPASSSSSSMNVDGGISISAPKMINTSNKGVPQVTIHPPISVTSYQAPSILHPSSSLQPPPPPPPPEQQQQHLESSSTNGEGELMTETAFLSTYSNEALYPRSQYKFLISFPSSGSSNSSQNQDPDIEIEQIDPSRTIKELKSEIASRYGKLSAPKIQLRTETGTFLKDANTIAYYNLKPGTNLDVVPKTRGGRK